MKITFRCSFCSIPLDHTVKAVKNEKRGARICVYCLEWCTFLIKVDERKVIPFDEGPKDFLKDPS